MLYGMLMDLTSEERKLITNKEHMFYISLWLKLEGCNKMGILKDIFTAALWGREPPAVPDWVEWIHISKG